MTLAKAVTWRGPGAKRIAGAALIAALCLALTACILMPGKFASNLDLRKDGRFSFAYKGEIHFISASDLDDKKARGAGEAVFEPAPCKTANGAERKCSPSDIDEQMRAWQEQQKQANASEAEQMNAMIGGLDLSDPKVAEEFARKLERQHGWRSVKSMGKGRFDIDFAIAGKLTHDFTFPVMEDMPLANPFVQVLLRQDGSARIMAPAFSNGPAGSPLKALAQLGAMGGASKVSSDGSSPGYGDAKDSGSERGKTPQMPRIDGMFTVTTDGTIVANNTDEGPSAVTTGQQLSWTINERTDAPPKALINLTK